MFRGRQYKGYGEARAVDVNANPTTVIKHRIRQLPTAEQSQEKDIPYDTKAAYKIETWSLAAIDIFYQRLAALNATPFDLPTPPLIHGLDTKMNSLNILSARVSPPPSRSNSYGSSLSLAGSSPVKPSSLAEDAVDENDEEDGAAEEETSAEAGHTGIDEKSPMLEDRKADIQSRPRGFAFFTKRIAVAFVNSVRWVVSAIMAPGFYIIACLYDQEGNFAPLFQVRRVGGYLWGGQMSLDKVEGLESERSALLEKHAASTRRHSIRPQKNASLSSQLSSESESERDLDSRPTSSAGRHTRSKSLKPNDETTPARRSIRIKLHNEDARQNWRHRKSQSTNSPMTQSDGAGGASPALTEITPATLKSPTSPPATLSMARYPRAPMPPRPLIPKRMPSYTMGEPINGRAGQKTLILDLDETLIHSMAKGGRMSTGHMVEVKLNTFVAASGVPIAGPQHPILYYVHKRPHCDDFLRRVCKWYNLVIFTASVQEYADPVIDWLEQERKFFSGRLYRQHCTFRHGAFIKDLSSVEPDLSRVMILDNSPLSYMFHQDNAIPIEGWINDPTDNDLLHLVPLLEGLQHVTDVRALLALRGGEDGKHMVT
ncbi:Nuclear envelope morphology protein 1 [Pseudogymnoascus australis]